MSYRNSERKTQEMMHATIAVAVARAMLFLRPRRFFCDEEDEEDVKGSIDIFSLSVFCARATTTTLLSLSLKEARFSLEFRMDFFQFISRHYIHYRERAREREYIHTHRERASLKTRRRRQRRADRTEHRDTR